MPIPFPRPEPLSAVALAALAAARRGADSTYAGRVVQASVVDIHDGDTIRIVFVEDPGSPVPKLVQRVVRIDGYDSPEVHPPASDPRRDEIRAAGLAAREAVARALGFDLAAGAMRGPLVTAVLGNFDKYGRILAELYAGEVHVNAAMIAAGFGVAYGGGSKAAAWAAAGATVGGDLAVRARDMSAVAVKKPRAPRAPRKPKTPAALAIGNTRATDMSHPSA